MSIEKTMINWLVVSSGLLLMSSLAFATSRPAPGDELVDGTPIIENVSLSITPAFPGCFTVLNGYTGVGCDLGDLTIAGTCGKDGPTVIAALRGVPLETFGLDADNEDIIDITEEGLEDRDIPELGRDLDEQNPGLNAACSFLDFFQQARTYQMRKLKKFVNQKGVISVEMELVPQD